MQRFFTIALIALGDSATAAHATGQGGFDPVQAGPSYPCGGRLTATEHAICRDSTLSELDRIMARHYYIKRDLSGHRARKALQRDQTLWLRWRDTCGADRDCLTRRYEQRILDLVPRDRLPPGFGCGGAGRLTLNRALLPPGG